MPSRLPRATSRALRQLAQAPRPSTSCLAPISRTLSTTSSSRYATTAASSQLSGLRVASDYVSPNKPPSARPVETRKSQLIRTYTSLLRTTPLILFFQHSNITAIEWAAIRRELRTALRAVQAPGAAASITEDVQLSVLRTRMFNVALKLVSFYDAAAAAKAPGAKFSPRGEPLVHDLSEAAYEAMKDFPVPEDSAFAQLEPLLVGPVAALVIPAVSPQHLAAALKVLAPGPAGSAFAPPTRRKNPDYYELNCQSGLSKLLLVGGRIEGSVFDVDGVRWVGGIENGLDGLRAQLVAMLQSAGLGLTGALEANSKNLWLSLESRRSVMEEEENGGKREEKAEEKAAEESS